MEIWVLIEGIKYDGESVIGAFTKENGIKAFYKMIKRFGDDIEISISDDNFYAFDGVLYYELKKFILDDERLVNI